MSSSTALNPLVINTSTRTHFAFSSRVSALSTAKCHIRYWGPVRGPHVEKTVSGTHNCLNYCEILTVYTQFTHVETHAVSYSRLLKYF